MQGGARGPEGAQRGPRGGGNNSGVILQGLVEPLFWVSPPVGVADCGVHRQLASQIAVFTASWRHKLWGSPPVGVAKGPGLLWNARVPTNFPETAPLKSGTPATKNISHACDP